MEKLNRHRNWTGTEISFPWAKNRLKSDQWKNLKLDGWIKLRLVLWEYISRILNGMDGVGMCEMAEFYVRNVGDPTSNTRIKSTGELRLSGLIGTTSHPDMRKIRIIGFLLENRFHWQFEVLLLLLTTCTCVLTFQPSLIWSSRSHNTGLYLFR